MVRTIEREMLHACGRTDLLPMLVARDFVLL